MAPKAEGIPELEAPNACPAGLRFHGRATTRAKATPRAIGDPRIPSKALEAIGMDDYPS
jgi:hypothetical protein